MKKTIAIVDDEIEILNTLKMFLSRSDKFEISTYSSPKVALNEVKAKSFDLILLDIMMPQIDGIEFLKDLIANSIHSKVIMMTAYSTEDKMINCNELGVSDYITKPFISLRDVENKVHIALDL